ncbi:hypothetical protein [Pseudonocardia asaccharolytica]|uniref:Uncharacterized protein n=1 Tax=Pseudonocardia asaccharolytica DSM 44247 = NBRC 16224 TaxID=1123024 RepID=A0A511D3F8_9PSEU|nr:hypothetical protein [Pseudonocardia asaccharolytica]GEL19319.1 hypothetical protein PA7_31560 [Pseudonocardia asaccharolytica DSM 44247 = NBRC 16224]
MTGDGQLGLALDTAPYPGQRLVWTQPDGAQVFVRVTRVHDGVVWLRCQHGGRQWTRRHRLPLFPSMRPHPWTAADVLETIP